MEELLHRIVSKRKISKLFQSEEIEQLISNTALEDASRAGIRSFAQLSDLYGMFRTSDAPVISDCIFRRNGAFGELSDLVIHRSGQYSGGY
jgi:hypothetical protein